MALQKRDGHWYGDSHADLHAELARYAGEVGYAIHHFADVACSCGNRELWLLFDETQGVAIRLCPQCELEHPMGDSAEYLDEAEPDDAECLCEGDVFEITVGVSLYDESEDVRWLYLGCRCVKCGLLGCYADWKNEFLGYQDLLSNM